MPLLVHNSLNESRLGNKIIGKLIAFLNFCLSGVINKQQNLRKPTLIGDPSVFTKNWISNDNEKEGLKKRENLIKPISQYTKQPWHPQSLSLLDTRLFQNLVILIFHIYIMQSSLPTTI